MATVEPHRLEEAIAEDTRVLIVLLKKAQKEDIEEEFLEFCRDNGGYSADKKIQTLKAKFIKDFSDGSQSLNAFNQHQWVRLWQRWRSI
jgi:hypothetical protein